MKFIDLQRQYQEIAQPLGDRIKEVMQSGQFVLGPAVTELEENLSKYVGVSHAITVANGTDALQLALMALDIKQNDLVLVPSFSFFASAEAVALVGAEPVFVDVEEDSFNLDPQHLLAILEQLTPERKKRVRAIISVDLFGLPADYEKIIQIANEYNLKVIADCAQSFGAAIGTSKVCSWGDIATTSFFPSKPLACYGDGGCIFTNDEAINQRLRSLRVHGQGESRYQHTAIGMNSRLDTIQAIVLLEKMKILPQEIISRNQVAQRYSSLLAKADLHIPRTKANYTSAWAQYTLRCSSNKRQLFLTALQQAGIGYQVYYPTPIHLQPAFNHLRDKQRPLPITEKLAQQVFSIPMHPYLSEEQQQQIANILLKV